jgi:hypothetical protein
MNQELAIVALPETVASVRQFILTNWKILRKERVKFVTNIEQIWYVSQLIMSSQFTTDLNRKRCPWSLIVSNNRPNSEPNTDSLSDVRHLTENSSKGLLLLFEIVSKQYPKQNSIWPSRALSSFHCIHRNISIAFNVTCQSMWSTKAFGQGTFPFGNAFVCTLGVIIYSSNSSVVNCFFVFSWQTEHLLWILWLLEVIWRILFDWWISSPSFRPF